MGETGGRMDDALDPAGVKCVSGEQAISSAPPIAAEAGLSKYGPKHSLPLICGLP
jgi:hypothetical protein